ncbi:MAG: tetratricopeptide repeat protein, partial [Vicinamibacterales bacterium]
VQALDEGKRDEAKAQLNDALAINPSHLEARAQLAAIAYIEDRNPDFDAEVARVLAISPRYGEVFRVAADQAAANFRYEDAAVLARRAVDLAPRDSRVLGDLGIHLLRVGDEPGARQALEASFKLDPFNVITYNLLKMLDTLEKFVSAQDGDIVLRLHQDEAPVLQEYALGLSQRALATLSKRYGFTPDGPILVEMFSKHDDFAVRNLGLPGMIGALGACFGRVVTLDSPKARPPGDFQWEATLWHELAHVITLQMSKYRVPRWLTEGISVYEETLARPEWGRGQDIQFAQMINQGQVLKLKDLNSGFTDPKLISISYFQASLVVEHLVATHGDEGLHRLLRAYGEGLDTEQALKQALNTDFDTLQVGFDDLLERRFGTLRKALALPEKGVDLQKMVPAALRDYVAQHPESYPAHMALIAAIRKSGPPESHDEALPLLEKAAALVPMAKGPTSPNAQIVEIALAKKDNPRAIRALREIVKYDFDNVQAARHLVELLKEAGVDDPKELEPLYVRITSIDPFDQDAHTALGQIAMKRADYDAASREFRAVLALAPVDPAAAHTDLAESYLLGGRKADARRQTLAALEIAPSYERAQDLLLKLAGDRP